MYITISEENKVLMEELKEEVTIIKQEAKKLSISFIIQLKSIIFQFLISYKEYSLTNIREYGLGEILMDRAMRFFKLDNENREKKASKKKTKGLTRKGGKYLIKKTAKLVLYPFYLLILMLEMVFKSNDKEKSNKNVKNVYRE